MLTEYCRHAIFLTPYKKTHAVPIVSSVVVVSNEGIIAVSKNELLNLPHVRRLLFPSHGPVRSPFSDAVIVD